ncbi:hypothetical protein LEN26_007222 [Aphanomyces euteiches]|nr:hypothetical protein AeMF1_020620 [Aphanomyces euteiches]KAH9132986.1 hypothetical protein LEN26_007222 [Aphanomyces euteiches]
MANIVTRPELLLRIVEFQHGFPHDILLLHPILSERNEDHKDEECLEQTLTPWLNEYGVSRLDVLTRYIPMARNNLMRYALESGNTDAPAALYPTSRDLLVPEPAWRAQYGYEPSNKPEPYWRYAVCGGHLQVVKYLHSQDHPGYDAEMMDLAAASGRLSIVEFLHRHRSEGCSTEAMDAAASRGHLEVVKFLHAHRSEGCTANAMDLAARYGHNDVVIWLSTHRHEGCTTDAMDNAAAEGNLDLVQWLSANRSEGCTTRAMDRAASNGHLHVVEWLHVNRTEGCTTNAMEDSAQYGHLPVVEFLASIEGKEHALM